MLQTLLPAIISLISVTVGAILTYALSRSAESSKSASQLRTQAYVDYLRCISESAHVNRGDATAIAALKARATDAKTRICVYGTLEILNALAAFEKNGASASSPDGRKALIRLCATMRMETDSNQSDQLEASLQTILLGPAQ